MAEHAGRSSLRSEPPEEAVAAVDGTAAAVTTHGQASAAQRRSSNTARVQLSCLALSCPFVAQIFSVRVSYMHTCATTHGMQSATSREQSLASGGIPVANDPALPFRHRRTQLEISLRLPVIPARDNRIDQLRPSEDTHDAIQTRFESTAFRCGGIGTDMVAVKVDQPLDPGIAARVEHTSQLSEQRPRRGDEDIRLGVCQVRLESALDPWESRPSHGMVNTPPGRQPSPTLGSIERGTHSECTYVRQVRSFKRSGAAPAAPGL